MDILGAYLVNIGNHDMGIEQLREDGGIKKRPSIIARPFAFWLPEQVLLRTVLLCVKLPEKLSIMRVA